VRDEYTLFHIAGCAHIKDVALEINQETPQVPILFMYVHGGMEQIHQRLFASRQLSF
jgi:hypothetical protein